VERVGTLAERFRIFQRGLFGGYIPRREVCVRSLAITRGLSPPRCWLREQSHSRNSSPNQPRDEAEMRFNEPFRVLISYLQRIAFVIRSKGLEAAEEA